MTVGDLSSLHPWVRRYFRDGDAEKVSQAVEAAEKNTSGDIVPMVVHRSANVSHVPQVLFLLLYVIALLGGVSWGAENENFNLMLFAGVASIVSFGLAFALARLEFIQRALISSKALAEEVHLRAELDFYRNHFDQTQNHGAVLIFISLMERRAVLLFDQVLAKKIDQASADAITAALVDKMKHGHLLDGLLQSIQKTGDLLSQHLPASPDGKHELSSQLRVED